MFPKKVRCGVCGGVFESKFIPKPVLSMKCKVCNRYPDIEKFLVISEKVNVAVYLYDE